ncbi:oligosaccharide flippase family protein [bacterium]|nr:oligosaccharide flippase family protein [bacterium]
MLKIFQKVNKLFPANTFRKNVVMMFSGTVASQAVYLLFYPFLTRIYSTSNFGQYAIFISFLSILSVIATGQYEHPLLLSKKERSFKLLTYGVILLTGIMSIVITIALLLAAPLLAKYNYFNSYELIAFLGFSILLNTLYQIGFYLSLRNKYFKWLSVINIFNVGFSILFQYFLSRTEFKDVGLIVGYMGGTFIATILLYYKNKSRLNIGEKFHTLIPDIKKQLVRYKKFPIFNLPATFVNLSANQVPQLLLITFGQAVVGNFALSQKVLGSPVTLFSTSISHVFRERASSDYRNKGNCEAIFVKTFKSLFLISIIPFILIFVFAPMLVPIVFGAEWVTAGIYIRALSLMYLFKFTVSPLTYVIIVAEKQNLNLLLMILLFACTTFAVWLGIERGDAMLAVGAYSIAYSSIYLLFLLISYKLSKNNEKFS